MGGVIRRITQILATLIVVINRIAAFLPSSKQLHTARFARLHELTSLLTHELTDEASLLLGITHFNHVLRVRTGKMRRELGSLLVDAPTRGGKGLLGIAQLLTWEGSAIVNDIKGELYNQTAAYRSTLGKVLVFDPTGKGNRYDPFFGKQTEDDLYELAKYLLYEAHEGDGRPFTNRAVKMLTQMFLGARTEAQPIFPYIRDMITFGQEYTAKKLHQIPGNGQILATKFLDRPLEKVEWDNKFMINSWETLTSKLYPLLLTNVIRSLAGSDFTAQSIIQSIEPVTIYLRWPEHKLSALSPVICLVWSTLLDGMITTFDSVDGAGCFPVLVHLDEAGNIEIPRLPEYSTTAVGRNIIFWIANQSPLQLEAKYGKYRAEILRDNMDSQLFYRPSNIETARYLEKRLGSKSGFASSNTLHDGHETSQGKTERGVPLMSAQEIMQMRDDDVIVFHHNLPPFSVKRMDWRRFPALVKRRNIPPPQLPELPPVIVASKQGREEPAPAYIDPDEID